MGRNDYNAAMQQFPGSPGDAALDARLGLPRGFFCTVTPP